MANNEFYSGWGNVVSDAEADLGQPPRRPLVAVVGQLCPHCEGNPQHEEVITHRDEPNDYAPCYLCGGSGLVDHALAEEYGMQLLHSRDSGAAARRARDNWVKEHALPQDKPRLDPRYGRPTPRR